MDHERDDLRDRRAARASAAADDLETGAAQTELALEAVRRATELERAAGRAMPSDATLADALAVLERNGEQPPEGLDTGAVLKVPAVEKIEHRGARVITRPEAAESAPPEAKLEHRTMYWASAFYQDAMRITAAGVLASTGSLDTAANVLWFAGFAVPPGSPEEKAVEDGGPLEGYERDDEVPLRAWVERERESIARAVRSEGLRLSGTGRLMEDLEE